MCISVHAPYELISIEIQHAMLTLYCLYVYDFRADNLALNNQLENLILGELNNVTEVINSL